MTIKNVTKGAFILDNIVEQTAIKNTPRGLYTLENILYRLVTSLRVPEKLGSYPINLKTIFSDAARLLFTEADGVYGLDTINAIEMRLLETYSINLCIKGTKSADAVDRVDSRIIENIVTKLCVLEFNQKLALSKALRNSLGIMVDLEEYKYTEIVDFAIRMSNHLIIDYNTIIRDHERNEKATDTKKEEETNHDVDVNKRVTPIAKLTRKSTSKSTTKKKATK